MQRRLTGFLVAGLLAGLVATPQAGAATAASSATAAGRQTHSGTLGGAPFRVEVPARWNGTLVLYSHGYHPVGFGPGSR